jgi:hypothetical protein
MDFIDIWHQNPEEKELYNFGMSGNIHFGSHLTPSHIARARRAGCRFEAALRHRTHEFPIAARSADAVKIDHALAKAMGRFERIRDKSCPAGSTKIALTPIDIYALVKRYGL